jgi:archaeosortase A (PGF-CTERM-specific)
MDSPLKKTESNSVAFLFILIPTIMLIVGYILFPEPTHSENLSIILLQIPMFLGLILLGIGFFIKNSISNIVKIVGWFVFAAYWATQPAIMYLSEDGDIFNAVVSILGVYILCYIAYHEWISLERKEKISCLNWIAGASSIAGIVYFGIERTALGTWLTERVAEQSEWILNLIIGNSEIIGTHISLDGNYAVTIIFACTAIQAMVVFIGMIGALPKINLKRRIIGLMITLIPIYILNLLRNAMVAFFVGRDITDFFIAHNVISKLGALITLIILLFIVVKLIPEIFDEIMCLVDLHKRNGPIEKAFKKIFGSKK